MLSLCQFLTIIIIVTTMGLIIYLPNEGASLVSDMAQLLASDLSKFLVSICDFIEWEPARLPAY